MTAQQTYDVITLPGGGWATGQWRDNFGGIPRFDTYETDFQTSLNNSLSGFSQQPIMPGQLNPFGFPGGLAGRYMNSAMGGSPILTGALGGLLGAGIDFFGRRRR